MCYANTGHAETVRVTYTPAVVSLRTLTEALFAVIDGPRTRTFYVQVVGADA